MSKILFNSVKYSKVIALLIGVTYNNSDYYLPGCDQDAIRFQSFLHSNGIGIENTIIMTENESPESELYPSKQNILNQLNQILEFSNTLSDTLVIFYYSGHGSNLIDRTGDEVDGRDEVLCPTDFSTSGLITDDYLKSEFIDKLNSNITLFSLIDACHSGTIFDLKYTYNNVLTVVNKKQVNVPLNNNKITNQKDTSQCTAINISGCRDSQTSIVAYINNQPQSLLTWAFINSCNRSNNLLSVITNMQNEIGLKFNNIQITTVGSNKNLDLSKITLFDNLSTEFKPTNKPTNTTKINRNRRTITRTEKRKKKMIFKKKRINKIK